MNIRGYISGAKEKFKQRQTMVRDKKMVSQAKRLEQLKIEREAAESMAKLYAAEDRERLKIEKAKAINKKHSGLARFKANIEKATGGKENNPYKLGGGPQWGSTGGGPNWSSLGPPTMKERGSLNTSDRWGLGPGRTSTPKKKKSRNMTIVIKR